MFRTLMKKQFAEIFRTYFYDQKKNTVRSPGQIVGMFILFAVLVIFVFGSICLPVCMGLCPAFVEMGYGWLYYALLAMFALIIGTFGSVFHTYTVLYAAKDNDLLLSMPIPVKHIMLSRLLSVYLMGLLYSSIPLICASAVYFLNVGVTVKSVAGAVMMLLIVSLIIFILSCGLGYVVAKISRKLKNKSITIVVLALAGLALYYYAYFNAMSAVEALVENAAIYGQQIKDSAYIIYLFGGVGTGEPLSILIFTAAVLAILAVLMYFISRSFIKIATSLSTVSSSAAKVKDSNSKSISSALRGKEFAKFLSSPTYMLNAGLGVLLIPAVGVFLLIKGPEVSAGLAAAGFGDPGIMAVAICVALSMAASMADTAVASVSLEGKNIWIPQSLPVRPLQVIHAKTSVQLILSGVPALFTAICAIIAFRMPVITAITFLSATAASVALCAMFYMFLGLKFVNLTWTNEMIPIKQGAGVLTAMLSTWGYGIAVGALYLPLIAVPGAAPVYLAVVTDVSAVLAAILYRWLSTRGEEIFANL